MTAAPTNETSEKLTLSEAAERRDTDGQRLYGSIDTLRRRVRSGELAHTRRGSTYLIDHTDLEQMRSNTNSEKAFRELEAAARRAAAAAPHITTQRREQIIAILRGSDH